MAWLEDKVKGERPIGEWAAGVALERLHRQEDMYRGEAYPPISATGANGAIGHYFPSRGEDSVIERESPYTIDAGGQYLDGTIDTTRSLYFGSSPSEQMKRAYTRVLQAHMAAATAKFARTTPSVEIQGVAKQWLYK